MGEPLTALGELSEAARRLAGLAMDILADRLELAGLELREAKLRLCQFVLLALAGAALLVLGLAMALVAVMLLVPPQWRPEAAALIAVVCLALGGLALAGLRRRLARRPLPFSQTVAECRKDRECF